MPMAEIRRAPSPWEISVNQVVVPVCAVTREAGLVVKDAALATIFGRVVVVKDRVVDHAPQVTPFSLVARTLQ